jgi:hypothetical protein
MIDAMEMIGVGVSPDGKNLRLRVRDRDGKVVSVSFPTDWLNAMVTALPHPCDGDTVHALESWSMNRIGNGQELVLTLRTPQGQAVSFAMKPWQVEGMATIATYGNSRPTQHTTVH